MKSAKEMFEELGYTYSYEDNRNNCCEDLIVYTHNTRNVVIQFNLLGKIVCFQMKNKYEGCDKIYMFTTKELIRAINKQMAELNW